MIRKFFYFSLIGFSLIFGTLKLYRHLLGEPIDLASYLTAALSLLGMPGAAGNLALPTAIPIGMLNMAGWACLALTAIFYFLGLVNIYRHAANDLWRAILFTFAALATMLGVGLFQLETMGLIDSSSLNLIAIMIIPFLPAFLMIPFWTTFKDYLSAKRSA